MTAYGKLKAERRKLKGTSFFSSQLFAFRFPAAAPAARPSPRCRLVALAAAAPLLDLLAVLLLGLWIYAQLTLLGMVR